MNSMAKSHSWTGSHADEEVRFPFTAPLFSRFPAVSSRRDTELVTVLVTVTEILGEFVQQRACTTSDGPLPAPTP